MTSEGTNRVPSGVRAGGQFAPATHGEAAVRLFDRHDGTFLKPSPSATARHCIEFWATVEIPDEIISQVESEYVKVRAQDAQNEIQRQMVEWSREYQTRHPEPRGDRKLAEYSEAYRGAYAEHYKTIEAQVEQTLRPSHLGEYDARQLIRAAQMGAHRPVSKFGDEGDKVLNEPIELFDEVLSVWEIEEKYELSKVHYAMERVFPRSDDAVVEALEGARAQLSGIREELASQRSDY